MTFTLYDASVAGFLRTTEAIAGILKKGREHYHAQGLDLESVTEERLCGDMLPLHFQINSVRHHSIGAIEGIRARSFSPPKPLEKTDYTSLEELVAQTIHDLKEIEPDEVNELYGKDMKFTMPGLELPFTAENFLMSFSIPNYFFHATTAYDILRMKGVPLGKRDFVARPVIKRG
ncbi:MAG: hypothetical protein CMK09_05440 [Ponticaulis sp.]|nr:hypothetical protein [Ponticaulis sp.]|tara:strand:+ start:6775 stop:7299 length:525 start_codon:yes stop_codon:yes gene_type:complete